MRVKEHTAKMMLDSELFYPTEGFQELLKLESPPREYHHCHISNCIHLFGNQTWKNLLSDLDGRKYYI